MFKSHVISVISIETLTALMLLVMVDFDVILGMDWLTSYHATFDCHPNVVKFEVPNRLSFVFRGDSCLTPATLISSLASLHLMDKSNPRFLTLVMNFEAEVPKLG